MTCTCGCRPGRCAEGLASSRIDRRGTAVTAVRRVLRDRRASAESGSQ
ncbi:hypothetical protein [Ornithinimicrobium kibberense]